jgi:hypothetical protein
MQRYNLWNSFELNSHIKCVVKFYSFLGVPQKGQAFALAFFVKDKKELKQLLNP